jgi:hypothetical protein
MPRLSAGHGRRRECRLVQVQPAHQPPLRALLDHLIWRGELKVELAVALGPGSLVSLPAPMVVAVSASPRGPAPRRRCCRSRRLQFPMASTPGSRAVGLPRSEPSAGRTGQKGSRPVMPSGSPSPRKKPGGTPRAPIRPPARHGAGTGRPQITTAPAGASRHDSSSCSSERTSWMAAR